MRIFWISFLIQVFCIFEWVHPSAWINEDNSTRERVKENYESGKEKIKDVYESGKEKAKDVYETGKEKARDVYETGKEKAKQLWEGGPKRSSDSTVEYIRNQYRNLVEELRQDLIDPLRSMKEKFHEGAGSLDTSKGMWSGYTYHTFENSYVILLEVPGIPVSELSVTLSHDVVTVKGEHHACIQEDPQELCLDRSVLRSFRIPYDVNKDKINASVKDGVLVIRLPKQADVQAGKNLEIQEIDVLKRGLKDRIKGSLGF